MYESRYIVKQILCFVFQQNLFQKHQVALSRADCTAAGPPNTRRSASHRGLTGLAEARSQKVPQIAEVD
jgi:hypothetical protein